MEIKVTIALEPETRDAIKEIATLLRLNPGKAIPVMTPENPAPTGKPIPGEEVHTRGAEKPGNPAEAETLVLTPAKPAEAAKPAEGEKPAGKTKKPAEGPKPAETSVPTIEDIRKVLVNVARTKGSKVVQETLRKFGIENLSDLPAERYADAFAEAKKLEASK